MQKRQTVRPIAPSSKVTSARNTSKIVIQSQNNIIITSKTEKPLIESSITKVVKPHTKKWLVIGIPTGFFFFVPFACTKIYYLLPVSRLHDEDYLLTSLETMSEQLPSDPSDPLYGRILIHVINMQAFKRFGASKERHSSKE